MLINFCVVLFSMLDKSMESKKREGGQGVLIIRYRLDNLDNLNYSGFGLGYGFLFWAGFGVWVWGLGLGFGFGVWGLGLGFGCLGV